MEWGFLQMDAVRFVARELRNSSDRKNSILLLELDRGVVCFLGFAETNVVRLAEGSPITDLIRWLSTVRGRCGELYLVIAGIEETLQRLLERAIALGLGKTGATAPSAGANLVPHNM